ncbi:uncharacterized protein FRV6_13081 [Fusarium oxysporum]|uniref:PD-(D/E)XK nuclease-like domain-containing protein n=1 Tax=Fusarium oxysporum TaxID=5507 RepID=A0A2H3TJZ7_FUSOX|nr:uncharacterized protein FRV6_13081 [Fusarium oxysporum]
MSPLCDKPIAISIETKKTGEDWEKAKLQMEVWMAAHWQFLRNLIKLRQRAAKELSSIRQAEGDLTSNPEKTWQLPDFMPGIIVQGDDWHLIITTPEGEKTIFWQKKSLSIIQHTTSLSILPLSLKVDALQYYWLVISVITLHSTFT